MGSVDAVLRATARASPGWLLAAVFLEALAFAAQGAIWRSVARRAGARVPAGRAFAVSLAKFFVDRAVPSGGLSGTVFAARALRRDGLSPPARSALVAVNLISYYAAYAAALAGGALAASSRTDDRLMTAAACFFLLLGGATALASRRLARRRPARRRKRRGIARLLDYARGADPALLRSPALFAACAFWQLSIFALNAAALWLVCESVGAPARPAPVFAALMAASAARSVSFVPGGVGPYEAAAVVALHAFAGMPVPEAISATLLFRALSFWLPLAAGLLASRRAL